MLLPTFRGRLDFSTILDLKIIIIIIISCFVCRIMPNCNRPVLSLPVCINNNFLS